MFLVVGARLASPCGHRSPVASPRRPPELTFFFLGQPSELTLPCAGTEAARHFAAQVAGASVASPRRPPEPESPRVGDRGCASLERACVGVLRYS